MSNFQESGLHFTFPKNWCVIKFDEHRFYKYVHGVGLKGVDFIGLKENGELLLIEVKNYADRFPQDGILPYAILIDDPIPFAEKIVQKFEDSFQLIEVIHKYYLRKFWFRHIGLRITPFIPHPWISRYNWAFWFKAYNHLSTLPSKVNLIWWMELGPEVTKLQRSTLHAQLNQYFATYFQSSPQSVIILDRHSSQTEVEAVNA